MSAPGGYTKERVYKLYKFIVKLKKKIINFNIYILQTLHKICKVYELFVKNCKT